MSWKDWYDALIKPTWTPDPSTISLVWQVLYPIILVTFGFVFYRVTRKRLPWSVAIPFAINLIANLAFTPIQFGLRNLPLAALDIAIVWLTILWAMKVIWPHHRWITLAQVPYLIWVTIASVLQFTITWKNW
jgi:tryptophan-rich sensory protein